LSPHPDKIEKGGEDAVFVSKNILVVADGVGSWKDFGVDPGIYSKTLIHIISDLVQDEEKRNYYIENPQKLAAAAVNLNKAQGSTTLSIITLHPRTGILKTYHIGDSIYGIFS
jgi:protein phosphatase PTC7